ncbi:MAG: RNA repair transcriptional activator RtcR [Planctomycetota bacterium]
MNKQSVVIGLLGTNLDRPRGKDRWSHWRPSVGLCQQPDLLIDRFELLYDPAHIKLAGQVAGDIRKVSPETEVCLTKIKIGDHWDFEEVYAALHDHARSRTQDSEYEDLLVHITTGTHVAQICLFLLAESRHYPARLLQSSPAAARRGRPVDPAGTHRIIDLDLSRYDQLAARFRVEREDSDTLLKAGIATRDAKFNRMIDQIQSVCLATDSPLLLTGPTGSGKTALAKRIYDLKRQRGQLSGRWVAVNCATIRGDQAMSTLFGHVRGAFTGAASDRDGLLRSADGGMLFLDEIGELGADEQAMLLHAIETKQFFPFGSDQSSRSDFQLIAGTHRDLQSEITAGNFREDLLYRIGMWTFALPGLADRPSDLEPNLDYELEEFARRSGRRVTMNREARQQFLLFASEPAALWRGNFRDLNAAVTRMATLCSSDRIGTEQVQEEIGRLRESWRRSTGREIDSSEALLSKHFDDRELDAIDRIDRVTLSEVLRVCGRSDSLAQAGRCLYQASRREKQKPNDSDRLRKYLAKFDLCWNRQHNHVERSPSSNAE